jgi:fructose-1,6-bisphosphatase/inositol monophosphatase family enzyme
MRKVLLQSILNIHAAIRDEVVAACERNAENDLSQIASDGEGDTIYAIDRISEERLIQLFESEIATRIPLVLIGEGLPDGKVLLPRGISEEDAEIRVIVDPIDGTRGLMYQKRSAWILTGVAPNKGKDTNLQDIELAMQTEIPLVKQHLSDVLWAEKSKGAKAFRYNRLTRNKSTFMPRPSNAKTIAHGFAMIARFFPGAREELAAIDEEIIFSTLGPPQRGKTHCFEDQYISTGGQLYELMMGHDRFVADLRPLMEKVLSRRGQALGICCHPYDVCTELIARECGVIVTDANGNKLQAPLDVESEIDWVGYANDDIRRQIETELQSALRKRNLID